MRKFSLFHLLLGLACVLIAIWLVAPTLVLLPISFAEKKSLVFPPSGFSLKWYKNFVNDPQWFDSFIVSLKIAVMVSITATVVGAMAAIGIERMKGARAGLLRAILITPIIVPGVVLAVGVYAVYLEAQLVGTWIGYVLAHTLLAVPFVVIAVGANLAVFDARLETAAASLGASRLTTFFTVTLPLILPGILSGALFAFVISFDEVIVSLFITSPQLKTLPVQIFSSMTRDSDPTVAAVGSLLFIATATIISTGLLIGMSKKDKA